MVSKSVTLSEGFPAESPDSELVVLAQAGEVDAFGALYDRYLELIYRYIRTRVTIEADAEDLTETVFLKAFESVDRYEDRGWPFSAYLYQIARNVIVDHYRQRREERVQELVEVEHPDPLPDERIVQKEHAQDLHAAMKTLPPDYQEVIRLRVMMELTTTEVAQWMDRSEGAVRVLLHRALRSLRQELELDGHGE